MSPRPLTTDTHPIGPGQGPERDEDAYWRAYWIDDAHRQAIRLAEEFANAPDRHGAGAWMALGVGGGDPTRVGTFLMAFDSASRALAIERRDRYDAFLRLAAERRADPAHQTTDATSGPPWSSAGGGHDA